MDTLPFFLRIIAEDADPLIHLRAGFRHPDGRRGGTQRAITMDRLVEALDQGFDLVDAQIQMMVTDMHRLTGLRPRCKARRLPRGWTTPRGPDTLVRAALERLH